MYQLGNSPNLLARWNLTYITSKKYKSI